MSEKTTNAEQITSTVQKALAQVGEQVAAAATEVAKVQKLGLERASALGDVATRVAKEQLEFAGQVGSEWRKVVLAATRSATELFTPRS